MLQTVSRSVPSPAVVASPAKHVGIDNLHAAALGAFVGLGLPVRGLSGQRPAGAGDRGGHQGDAENDQNRLQESAHV